MRKVPKSTSELASKSSTPKFSKFKILSIASIGNCLELYDYTLYGIMLPFLAMKFFPTDSQDLSMFIAFVSFAVSFIIAPIGSIFWGWYGDKFGRFKMLRLSMIFMAIPSLGIALLPDYQVIGFLAPALLIMLRIMQGISASGEIMGAKIFAMELLGPKLYGTCSGVISSTGALGVLMAMGMGYVVATNTEITYLWRLPFLVGSLLFVVAYFIRVKSLQSTHKAQNNPLADAKVSKLLKIIREHNYPSLIVFILGAMLGILSYTMHTFINPFLIQQGFNLDMVYQFSIYGLIATMITALVAGIYMDKNISSLFAVVKANIFWISILTLPFYILLLQGGYFTLIGYIALGGLLGIYACISAVLMYRLFLPDIRCRGILFNYAMGCAIFGGITPLILSALGNINAILPGIAVFICGMIIFVIFKKSIKYVNLY